MENRDKYVIKNYSQILSCKKYIFYLMNNFFLKKKKLDWKSFHVLVGAKIKHME